VQDEETPRGGRRTRNSLLGSLLLFAAALQAAGPDYPAAYRDLGLPEYQNATLTGTGREITSLRDGLALTLVTREDDATLRAYYEAEMSARGWILEETVASRKMRAAGMLDKLPFGAVFSKDGMRYQVSTGRQGTDSVIHINVTGQ